MPPSPVQLVTRLRALRGVDRVLAAGREPRWWPWGLSAGVHLALAVLTVFVAWTVGSAGPRETVAPSVVLGLETTPMLTTEPMRVTAPAADRVPRDPDAPAAPAPRALVAAPTTPEPVVGLDGPAAPDSPLAQLDRRPSPELETAFFGASGNARRVVFLVDASGSLIDTLPIVIRELQATIDQLSAKQQFTVMFFQGAGFVELPPAGLKPATPANRRRAKAWIDLDAGNIHARSTTDPLPAVRAALSYRAQLLFILSDNITGAGRGSAAVDPERLLAEIDRANAAGATINTIQFLYRDPLAGASGGRGVLERIAERTGGVYRFVGPDALE